MRKSKKEIDKAISQVEKKYWATLEQVQLKWLRSVYREATEGGYGFKSLGEVVAFMVDHAEDLKKALLSFSQNAYKQWCSSFEEQS